MSGHGISERGTVSVLGSTRIDGVALTGQQRTLVATLALRRGGGASTERLIDAVWFDGAPLTARQSLQNQIGRLRRRFGQDVITTDPTGYHLGRETDAGVFAAAVIGLLGRAPEIGDAVLLTGVLGLWAGTPYEDLEADPVVEAERARLLELRALAVERRAEAHMLAGDDRQAVLELTEATAAEPYRETGWALLMRALHLGGREIEALAAFEQAVGHLAELGAAPSHALRSQCRAITSMQPTQRRSARLTAPPQRSCQRRKDGVPTRWCAPAPN